MRVADPILVRKASRDTAGPTSASLRPPSGRPPCVSRKAEGERNDPRRVFAGDGTEWSRDTPRGRFQLLAVQKVTSLETLSDLLQA